jgi:hypothetical protein
LAQENIMNDPHVIQRKAFAFVNILFSMGQLAAAYAGWTPRPFVGTKPRRTTRDRSAAAPAKPHSPEHLAAVATMREARQAKRIQRAKNLLADKRARQARQWRRHQLLAAKP